MRETQDNDCFKAMRRLHSMDRELQSIDRGYPSVVHCSIDAAGQIFPAFGRRTVLNSPSRAEALTLWRHPGRFVSGSTPVSLFSRALSLVPSGRAELPRHGCVSVLKQFLSLSSMNSLCQALRAVYFSALNRPIDTRRGPEPHPVNLNQRGTAASPSGGWLPDVFL